MNCRRPRIALRSTFSKVGTLGAICLIALSLVGCAGYKLGPTNGAIPGDRTVEVKPFSNQTLEPRLSEYVTSSLRQRLQQDGTYKLETHEAGDIFVSGTITDFRRSVLSLVPSDVRVVRDYYLYLTATVTAVDRTSGKTLLSRKITGRTAVRVGADLTAAERQAIPLLADDLARQTTSLLADGTW